jgi:hypothetical protein
VRGLLNAGITPQSAHRHVTAVPGRIPTRASYYTNAHMESFQVSKKTVAIFYCDDSIFPPSHCGVTRLQLNCEHAVGPDQCIA